MQSNTEPSNDRNPDLFAELVQSIHQSHLLLNTSSTQSTSASPRTTYSGEAEECSGFLLQCSLLFEMQPQLFPSDRAKIAYIISLLSGRALQWAWSVWDAQGPITNLLTAFVAHFKEVFGQSPNKLSVNDQLFQLRQGQSSVNDYAFQFHTLAATSGWNKAALITAFRQGLNVNICQQMAIYDVVGLENFIQRAIRVSQHLTACNLEVTALSPPPASPSVPEPMQIDSYHLTHAEHQWRVINGLCLYCGAAGHLMSLCPVRLPHPAVSTLQLQPMIAPLSLTTVWVTSAHQSVSAQALLDSGSSGNFISLNLLRQLNLKRKTCSQPLNIHTILGTPLGRGKILYCSPTIMLRIGCLHRESISFLVLDGSAADIILGRPWLTQHSPQVKWNTGEILQWSDDCLKNCMSPVQKLTKAPSSSMNSEVTICSMTVERPETLETPEIPPDYRVFQGVFKQAAMELPPHRPWDCVIDLLHGATLPKGRVYPLSIPEQKAMEEYIEALKQEFICPSTSPAASSFFFCQQ